MMSMKNGGAFFFSFRLFFSFLSLIIFQKTRIAFSLIIRFVFIIFILQKDFPAGNVSTGDGNSTA